MRKMYSIDINISSDISHKSYYMKDKKAAKLIIKRAKKHPGWYTKEEVKYAKSVRKRIKKAEKDAELKRFADDKSE